MPTRDLPHFHKGAQIALKNILEDYLGYKNMSLLEVVRDLEDKRLIVGGKRDDWERRCAVEGGKWVGEAVEQMWLEMVGTGDAEEGDDADDDAGADECLRADVDEEKHKAHGYPKGIEPSGEDGHAKHDDGEDGILGGDGEPGRYVDGNGQAQDHGGEDNSGFEEGKEHNEAGARVVICSVRLLERWTEIQIENASKAT